MKPLWLYLGLAVACSAPVRSSEPAPATYALTAAHSESHLLTAPGIEVEIHAHPYRLEVRSASGAVQLSSGSHPGSGHGGAHWAFGSVEYSRIISAGYTSFLAQLAPWQSHAEQLSVSGDSTHITLTWSVEDGDAQLVATHIVSPSRLRVEVHLQGSESPRAWSTGFRATPNEGFLGFGERFNTTNQRGRRVWSWIEEGGVGTGEAQRAGPDNPMPNGEMMTYYAVPFFLSTEGYGFWLDTSFRSEFDLAAERPDEWRAWHVGKRLAYEIYLPNASDPRPWPYHIIDRFTEVTGRPMLPPAWAFGPRRRVGPGRDGQGVQQLEAMRDLDIAVTAVDDAVHFFPSGAHLGKADRLREWTTTAKQLGYRVNGYYNSFVDRNARGALKKFLREGKDAGYFVRLADGSFPDLKILTGKRVPSLYLVDFSQPGAADWYANSFNWALDLGYSGWMYDFGEYFPADAVGGQQLTGEELHNAYPTLYARALHDSLKKNPKAGDWLAFQRSGYTGTSQYVPFIWSGDPAASFEDSDGLPSMIPAGVNLGISGAPHFGADIGGFHCVVDGAEAADAELVTRWVQLGSMSSNMMDQNACVGGLSQQKASLWNSPSVLRAWQIYSRLHTRLFPYLYTLAHEASRTGAPVMRHPFLEFPAETQLAGVDDAYFLGPALYVMPVIRRGARQVTRLLPPGDYLDLNTRRMVEARNGQPREVTLPAPLDALPLLLRHNQILPLLDENIDTLSSETSKDVVGLDDVSGVYDLTLLLTRPGGAELELYDGCKLRAHRSSGSMTPPVGHRPADSATALIDCDDCYRLDQLESGLIHARVTTRQPHVDLGALSLESSGCSRKLRWSIYWHPDANSNRTSTHPKRRPPVIESIEPNSGQTRG